MNENPQNSVSPKTIEQVYQPVTRRTFLKGTAAAMAGLAGLVAALKPLLALERGEMTLDDLLQKHYRELKPEELQRILRELEARCAPRAWRPTRHS
jgi:cytochrome c-type biogenesis protein CcmH/NrfG